MIPGVGPQIKEALTHLKRISDSKRRANALKAVDTILTFSSEERTDLLKIADDILHKEYLAYTDKSPEKHSV